MGDTRSPYLTYRISDQAQLLTYSPTGSTRTCWDFFHYVLQLEERAIGATLLLEGRAIEATAAAACGCAGGGFSLMLILIEIVLNGSVLSETASLKLLVTSIVGNPSHVAEAVPRPWRRWGRRPGWRGRTGWRRAPCGVLGGDTRASHGFEGPWLFCRAWQQSDNAQPLSLQPSPPHPSEPDLC